MGLFGSRKKFKEPVEIEGNMIDFIGNDDGERLELYETAVVQYDRNREVKNLIELGDIRDLERKMESKRDTLKIKGGDKITFKINKNFRDDLNRFADRLSDISGVDQHVKIGDVDELRRRRAEDVKNNMINYDFYAPHKFFVKFPNKVAADNFSKAMGAMWGKRYLGSALAGYALFDREYQQDGKYYFRFAEKGIVFEKGNPDGSDRRIPWRNIRNVAFDENRIIITLTNGTIIGMHTQEYYRKEEVHALHEAYVDALIERLPSLKEDDGW